MADGIPFKERKAPQGETSQMWADKKTKATHDATGERFNILGLPGDLLDYLSSEYLEAFDFFSLRLVSSHFRKMTSKAFGRRFFKKMTFMLSPQSLAGLSAISRTEHLATHIRHIDIGMERLQSDMLFAFHVQASRNDMDEWFDEYEETYERVLQGQKHMERVGLDVRVLVRVFKSLPNLESVGVTDSKQSWGAEYLFRKLGARDHGHNRASRGHHHAPVHLYGEIPERELLLGDVNTNYHAFEVLFEVLQEVANPDLKVDLEIPESRWGFNAIPFTLGNASTKSALRRVRTLTLHRVGFPDVEVEWHLWVKQLFRNTTSATSVQLHNLQTYSLEFFLKPVSMGLYPHLTSLRLHALSIETEVLRELLQCLSPSLKTLGLSSVYLKRDAHTPGVESGKWAGVLNLLRGLPELRVLSLKRLSEYCEPNIESDNAIGDGHEGGAFQSGMEGNEVRDYPKTQWFPYGIEIRGHQQIATHLLEKFRQPWQRSCLLKLM